MESELKPVVFELKNIIKEDDIDKFRTALVQIRMGQPVSPEYLPYFETMEKELT